MSAPQKSRGAGAVLFLILLFLAIAGGSAWLVHTVLNREEPSLAGDRPPAPSPESSSASDEASAAARVRGTVAPHVPDGKDGASARENSSATLPGGVMVESIPGGAAESASRIPGRIAVPPVIPGEAGEGGNAAEQDFASSSRFLAVPGAGSAQGGSAGGDLVVLPAFVDDIATFLARNYWPKGTHPSAGKSGITTASLRWANLRYGADLRGLEGRQAVLHHVLTPGAISKLYALYADSFVNALSRAAGARVVGEDGAGRFLTDAEKKEMFTIYAAYAASVANALERYAATPGMAVKVAAYADAEARLEEANKMYIESVIAHENSMDGADKNLVTASRFKRDKDAATYQKRVREREAARRDLVTAMSGGKAADESNDTLVYVAFWAYRRGPDSTPGLKAGAKAFADIGVRLSAAAKAL